MTHLWHCILYEFQRGSNTTAVTENLCIIFGNSIRNARTAYRCIESLQMNLDLECPRNLITAFCNLYRKNVPL
ncbi:hypothetical protein WH47_07451 [Habropoda laboriosa]|uniref:Mos1 transposase HTH domain-containing protein n=1 Tax=Habropoda laboriosa TaxID=597456 RepID=A0A0L7QP83_9HYME|nr:hypothetical protein WH47_07451 [Habropoda laboriosa]